MTHSVINAERIQKYVNEFWDQHIVTALKSYIQIPNISPHYDAEWEQHGHMEKALRLVQTWLGTHKLPHSQIHVGRLPGRTPLLLIEIPGAIEQTILMYGHLDKQPEMSGWRADLDPWIPIQEGDRLYGRGVADDGYAVFASLCAIKALHDQKLPHARIVILIEFSEESGSPDLPAYVETYGSLIGSPDLVICLDSGASNYQQLWSTTSLRGMIGGTLKVEVLQEGVHSGNASGIVPSSFRIIRQLLSRIEHEESGEIFPDDLNVPIPESRVQQAYQVAEALGNEVYTNFPWMEAMVPMSTDPAKLVLNRAWKAALSIVGQEGIPPVLSGGNVLRPFSAIAFSLRLPPHLPAEKALSFLKKTWTEQPPYGAKITLTFGETVTGWEAPALAPWMESVLEEASQTYYRKRAMFMGEGWSIPFMSMLGRKFPQAQFIITGVLGPHSNAHGPNEFLHIPYAKKLTACIAYIVAKHASLLQ